MSDNISIERKITFQTFGKPGKEAKEKETHVLRVIGFVDSYRIDTGTYGDFPVLFGDFMAINPSDEKARAGKAIFPMFVFEQFRYMLDQGLTRVEIGIDIGTKPSEKGNTGYEWVVKPIFTPKAEDDPLLLLFKKAPALLESSPKEKPTPKHEQAGKEKV